MTWLRRRAWRQITRMMNDVVDAIGPKSDPFAREASKPVLERIEQ
jgi:hypothetical protein